MASVAAHAASPTGLPHGGAFARGHILVAPKSSVDDATFAGALSRGGGHSIGRIGGTRVHIVNVPPGNEEAAVRRLQADPAVKFAEVDRLISAAGTANDPYYTSEWHLPDIGAPTAWDYATGSGVTIAILDTGVDGTHPDLVSQMVPGWNFYNNSSNTADSNGHGTAVAGTAAAATNNAAGVASVAGGARIMPVVIADPNAWAYWSTVAQGITWAADHGARVASLSYQGASASSTIQSAASYLRSKGGVLFVAAGNTGAIDNTAPTSLMMVVSAIQQGDTLASFSTYGSFVDISAPGNNIISTAMGGGYWNCWGTSFATPIVAATAALILSERPDFTPSQVDATLESTAKDLGAPGYDVYYGYGNVNAAAALQYAASVPLAPAPDTMAPTVAVTSPAGGTTVAGTVSVSANASDNVGVTHVDLRVNGVVVASDTTSPYAFSWNSAGVANGTVTLTAAAYDAAGNSAVSSPVAVNVSNTVTPPPDTTPPTVSIASPTGGTVSGNVPVSVNASDNVSVTRVDLLVNGAVVATSNVGPWQFTWNSATVSNGSATLTAKAYDAAGNVATSSTVSVNVSNGVSTSVSDTTPPVVAITSPSNGSTVPSKVVSINTSATDNSGAAGITQRLYIDGVLVTTVQGGALGYNWNARKAASGTHAIKAIATDAAGNSATTQIQVTKK
ncbi:MAG TPA: S8 family serine peptidase [Casimicrobiaceae bacterium]|nr:S8 family serine peptidase [Casimicrobiaceae bacterium]